MAQQVRLKLDGTTVSERLEINETQVITRIDSTFERHVIEKVKQGNDFSFTLNRTIYNVDTTYGIHRDSTVYRDEQAYSKEENLTYKLKYINIPLSLGYEFVLNNKWLLEGFINSNLALLTHSSGSYLAERNVIEAEFETTPLEVSKVIWSYKVGLGFGYFLTPEMTIRVRPEFQQIAIGPLADEQINKNGLGLGLGLRYAF